MPSWLNALFDRTLEFMPHGHCYFWLPSLLWLHVISDALIGLAYLSISLGLYLLVKKIRLPFSPVFIAFGLFIGLCGLTHFMAIWTVWNPDYWIDGFIKAATATASVVTAFAVSLVKPQVEEVVQAAKLSSQRKSQLESANAELEVLYGKLRDASNLKTQFFANVSHELRTPLTLIIGPLEKLMRDPSLSAEHLRQLEVMRRNGHILLKQVNDLLAIARVEESGTTVAYTKFDVAESLRRISSHFELVAEEKSIEFCLQIPQNLTLEADPNLIERVMVNLIGNAFKFTPVGGRITIQLTSDAQSLDFSVADTGPGISPDQHRRIFQRFRQADGGTTRKYGGTGLGLAISKEIVESHHGSIDLRSAPGKGAVFAVRMPLRAPSGADVGSSPEEPGTSTESIIEGTVLALQQAEAAPSAQQPVNPQGHDKPRVLVVEDNEEMRSFIADTLSPHYQVETAGDGREGLARALATPPDLILTDLMMPHLSGEQLLAAVRGQAALDYVPVLLLTARTGEELRVQMLESGAQDYLTKPFLPKELVARVTNLVAAKQAGDLLRLELASSSQAIDKLAAELATKHRQLKLTFDAAEIAREQAERAASAKARFLASMSHEMRTPLSVIAMNADILRQAVPSELHARVDPVRRSAQRLTLLVDDVLQYTRVESGELEAHFEFINGELLAREVVEAARPGIVSDGVTLKLHTSPGTTTLVNTDPRLLKVALAKILDNALKVTPKGEVSVSLSSVDDWHLFAVADCGPGLTDEERVKLFTPFEQFESTRHKGLTGAGLSLALTKEIIDVLGGRIEVRSAPAKGSVFTVFLPR